MRHLLGLHVKTNQHYFFHFAIPRIQEDDLYKIIVQNLGGPTYMKLLGFGIHAQRHDGTLS
jgi:hypothetical protein